MKVNHNVRRLALHGEEGQVLQVEYDNRGDPYRQGVTLEFDDPNRHHAFVRIFLEAREGVQLRDKLIELFPLKRS